MIKKLLKIIVIIIITTLICFCFIICCVGLLSYKEDNMPYEEDNYVDEMPDYESHDSKRDTFWLKRPDNDLIIRAENGDAEAQYQIGKIFFEAYHDDVESTSPIKMEGVDDFYDEAIKWLTKSAQQDNLGAQICLSNLYLYCTHRRLRVVIILSKSRSIG